MVAKARKRHNRVELIISLALFTVILGGGKFGPIDAGESAHAEVDGVATMSLQSYWRATMLELRASWRGVFGEARGGGYQLYASMGNPDVEALQRYHSAESSEDASWITAYR